MLRVSVIMPMYNALPYVGEAIESIINQTFQDWELLVIDDHSTDDSPDIVRTYAAKDRRVKLVSNKSGIKGVGSARNIGIGIAAGEYIVMMDADDISLPKRLETQVAFMERHPDIVLAGCYAKLFDKENRIVRWFASDKVIKASLVFRQPFVCSTIIFRRQAITEKYSALAYGEDTVFCTKIALYQRVANIKETLYLYRVHYNSTTFNVDQEIYTKKMWEELLPLRLGFIPTREQVRAHMGLRSQMQGISLAAKCRWILYVFIHGKYKWYERLILVGLVIRHSLGSLFFKLLKSFVPSRSLHEI